MESEKRNEQIHNEIERYRTELDDLRQENNKFVYMGDINVGHHIDNDPMRTPVNRKILEL